MHAGNTKSRQSAGRAGVWRVGRTLADSTGVGGYVSVGQLRAWLHGADLRTHAVPRSPREQRYPAAAVK